MYSPVLDGVYRLTGVPADAPVGRAGEPVLPAGVPMAPEAPPGVARPAGLPAHHP
ncbi:MULTISPECIES: hypothetical protein [unclassified Streptomyces]|uniref:hypothetical protein n=1 Tax=unclassified Streptomyces TaxID=2593676 RepID=UPI00364FB047